MSKTPLYRSIRASFSKDIYMPMCGVVAAPSVVAEIKSSADLALLTCTTPPQNVILHIASDLTVCDEPLYDVLAKCNRSVPILYFDDIKTQAALAEFTDANHVGDAILCAPFNQRDLLSLAYEKMPLLRGMLDCRGTTLLIDKLPAESVSHGATAVILDADVATADNVHSLQQRFIHVIADSPNEFDTAAARGVNGVITSNLAGAYDFLAKFPEGSFLRRRNLLAHKGFQNNGMYSENTITSVVAAGKHHFDGAEIDVKLTSDDVPVVMHNLDTKGLFDCPVAVTEKSDFAFLSSLRRIEFPDESIDRFEDLMHEMKSYPDTPVLIEIKPHAKYHNVEKLTAMTDDILRDGKSQTNCIGILGGTLEPGLRYVHNRLPYLPMGYCEGGKSVPAAPECREEAEDRIYRVAQLTSGCAAGYNPEDVNINRLFNEYAKFRMMHIFVWSRSWTLSPSKWEENGPLNDKTYIAGFDAWTTDHGEKFLDYPIAVEPINHAPDSPRCRLRYRDGSTSEANCDMLLLNGNMSPDSTARVMYAYTMQLHFSDSYTIYSEPITIKF